VIAIRLPRHSVAIVAVLGLLGSLSCKVNDYCINCETGDGGIGDGPGDGDAGDATPTDGDGGQCIVTGVEVCDDEDNDCDGAIDEGMLPQEGDSCENQVGEGAGGVFTCVGGAIKCTKNPSPEQCDLKDNDCNGQTDEGDPGGGARCGTDQGECVRGTQHCNKVLGQVQCGLDCGTVNALDCSIGGVTAPFGIAETCNGKDDDCDGDFDEDVPQQSICGQAFCQCSGGPALDPDEGECQIGQRICDGAGGTVCAQIAGQSAPQGPTFEGCDNQDNDCDGFEDEDTDLAGDPTNCGTCANVCDLPNAFEACEPTGAAPPGRCVIAACGTNFHDNNLQASDGCEFGPCTITSSVEVCNGIDDDCNPATGNNPPAPCGDCAETGLPTPPNFCLTQGACAGSTASCQGALGFRCSYSSEVTQDADGNVLQETKCDGIDNDCDGAIDEGQPNLGQACNDGGAGVCAGTGTFQCDTADLDGPAVCVISNPGDPPGPELCDGKDNNCDGIVDNTTGPDRVIDDMIHVQVGALDFFIDTYEASRPDARPTSGGVLESRACSNPDVVPWNNVTFATAQTACQAANKVLCTGPQWQAACEGTANTTYPYGNAFDGNACNTESFDGIAGGPDDDVVLRTGAVTTCDAANGTFDLSGNLKEWTNDITGQTGNGTNIAVLRGGSFQTPAVRATCDFRLTRAAVNVIESTSGFRCCRLLPP